jgi:hypothetical protein
MIKINTFFLVFIIIDSNVLNSIFLFFLKNNITLHNTYKIL